MELSTIQRELQDLEPLRKKIFFLMITLLLLACINFLFDFGEVLLTFNSNQFSNPLQAAYIIFEDVSLPILYICIILIGFFSIKKKFGLYNK